MFCSEPNPDRLKRRHYVPGTVNLCSWPEIEPLFLELYNRPIASKNELIQFLLDSNELLAAMSEESARLYLALSVNTADEEAKQRFLQYNQEIVGNTTNWFERLDVKFLDDPHLQELDPDRYGQLIKLLNNKRNLFRKENIPLSLRESALFEKYNALTGGLTVDFDGQKRNLTQMALYLKSPDRDLRERAWRVAGDGRKAQREEIDGIYDELIKLRTQIAINAGFVNFRDYSHTAKNRFFYTPDDCFKYHEMVEAYVVPIVREQRAKRCAKLGLPTLRPGDLRVDLDGGEVERIFKGEEDLVESCATVLDRIYPELGNTLRLQRRSGNLDLTTRHNKSPVGFNMPFDETGISFIFMNATGTFHDAIVLLHESGHAIETIACSGEPLFYYRHTPQEWTECSSQSIELLALDHLDVFYADESKRKRAITDKLEDLLLSLVSAARMDAFQQWIYTHPQHTWGERTEYWNGLGERFEPGIDYEGLDEYLGFSWQSVLHLFVVPFYYIEYGITALSALQVLHQAIIHGQSAVDRWLNTMKLGSSRSVPDLYKTAGLTFALHGDVARDLVLWLGRCLDAGAIVRA